MSFRYYVGKVANSKREKIKAYSVAQLEKVVKDDCVRPYMIAKEVYGGSAQNLTQDPLNLSLKKSTQTLRLIHSCLLEMTFFIF